METEEQIPNITIGLLLRENREKQNLSLKVISQQTKISVGLLELLENDQLDKLPSKIYVRGFVKSTAKVLGIDVKYAHELLDQGYASFAPAKILEKNDDYIPKESLDFVNSLKNSALTSSSLVAKILIGFVFVAILGINIKSYLERAAEEPKQKLPTVLTTVHQKVKSAPKTPSMKQPKLQKMEEVNSSMPVNLIEDHKEKTAPVVKPVEKEVIVELPKDELDKYLPAKFQILPPKGFQFVFLNAADGDSWITYKVDKAKIKKYVLRQGRTVFIHGEVVRLFIGNIKTIKIFYNKKLITFKEKSGTKNLVFPETLRAQYPDPQFIFEQDGTVKTSTP